MVTAIVTARLQAVFKPSSRPVFKTVFKTLRLRESAADLAPRHSELQNCGFQGVCVAAVTPFVV